MSDTRNTFRNCYLGCSLVLATILPYGSAQAGVLHQFQGDTYFEDGAYPLAGLIMDSSGNLYGTTQEGGTRYGCDCGTVFRLAGHAETILYAFGSQADDGELPEASLIIDKKGNLYGTTKGGGNTTGCNGGGCGTVFKLANDGTEVVLYKFLGGSDGAYPRAGLIRDGAGDFYGTTAGGGGSGCSGGSGCGTVFKLAADGTETILHSFSGGSDGTIPVAGLIMDEAGNLYGTTEQGGNTNCSGYGCGTVFKVATDGTETVLYTFCSKSNCADGAEPYANVIVDSQGNFYGTTGQGGSTGCYSNLGCGTVFKLTSNGTETVLYAFLGGNDGANPVGGLIFDKEANLFGTTNDGGGSEACFEGCGTVFKLAPNGTETVLYSFGGRKYPRHGSNPQGSLLIDKGHLVGTTQYGGDVNFCYDYGCGVVFSLKK